MSLLCTPVRWIRVKQSVIVPYSSGPVCTELQCKNYLLCMLYCTVYRIQTGTLINRIMCNNAPLTKICIFKHLIDQFTIRYVYFCSPIFNYSLYSKKQISSEPYSIIVFVSRVNQKLLINTSSPVYHGCEWLGSPLSHSWRQDGKVPPPQNGRSPPPPRMGEVHSPHTPFPSQKTV